MRSASALIGDSFSPAARLWKPSGRICRVENSAYNDALLPTAVTITVIIHPARTMMRDAGPAHNGANNAANDRARRPCDDGSRTCADCCAGDGSLSLRIRRYGKGGQSRECCSNTEDENFTHDRVSSFPGA
jgi:hypothetical protein